MSTGGLLAGRGGGTYNRAHAGRFVRPEGFVRTRSLRSAALLLAAAAVLSASVAFAQLKPPATAGSTPRSLEPPADVLVASGPAPDLILLYTGDVIGYVEPCG
jgi:hypothetical protein